MIKRTCSSLLFVCIFAAWTLADAPVAQTAAWQELPIQFDNLPQSQEKRDAACQNPANPIVAENCLPGTDAWIVTNYGSPASDIHIFASTDTANLGESLDFFVETNSSTFDLSIYRNGYYGGLGGRLIETIPNLPAQSQPACAFAADTGLSTCSRWISSYNLTIPADWVSGIYIAKATQPDTGIEGYTVFVVRDDERDSQILYQQSYTTFQAYNNYGGKSLYSWSSGNCNTLADAPRAIKVSLNRPYNQPMSDPNMYFRAEFPMMRWLEANGYDLTYSTNMDTHRSGKPDGHNELLDHEVFLSVGHDEYWSQEMRDAITAARDAGVHIGFFTANTGYWKVRFEPDPITNEPDSVMVNYKTTESGIADPVFPTTTWRDPAGANDPENLLQGVMYIGDNDRMYFPLRVTAEQAQDSLYRSTGLADMPEGSYADLGSQIVGWEWDRTAETGTPENLAIVAETPIYGLLLQDAGNSKNANMGQNVAQTTRYIHDSGAIVFASGTIQWSWGLGAHGIAAADPDPYMTQITYNILADMGAQPITPTEALVLDGEEPPADRPAPAFKTATTAQTPVISNIQAVLNGDSVTISWNTDIETTGQVWFGARAGHIIDSKGLDTVYSTQHSFVIPALESNTTYYFKVASVGRDWAQAISDENSFATGSISFTRQLSSTFSPIARGAACFARANLTGIVVFSAVVGVTLIAWEFTRVRRRRARRANAV